MQDDGGYEPGTGSHKNIEVAKKLLITITIGRFGVMVMIIVYHHVVHAHQIITCNFILSKECRTAYEIRNQSSNSTCPYNREVRTKVIRTHTRVHSLFLNLIESSFSFCGSLGILLAQHLQPH